MKQIAVILSGAGVFDGSEIHESVLTLLAIETQGASYQCFAPDINQLHVINHLTGEIKEAESRNVLEESARIARGDVKPVTELDVSKFDALILPGGFGAAKNLCNFAVKGAECDIQADVKIACQAFAQAKKPAGYICIAPAMIPLIYGKGVQGTIGTDEATADAYNSMGGQHINCQVSEFTTDEKNNVVSTPAYMLAGSISEAASGINKLVEKVIALASE